MHPYVDFFGLSLKLYYVMMITGFILAITLSIVTAPKFGFKRIHIFQYAIIGAFLILVGSKVGYFVTDGYKQLINHKNLPDNSPLDIFSMFNGLRFFGGLIFYIAGGFIYAKAIGKDGFNFLSVYAIFAPLGLAIGRIGCFLNGCCYGVAYNGLLAVTFPHTHAVHPLQLYESAAEFIFFGILLYMLHKKVRLSIIGISFLLMSSSLRFITEYLRPDANWISPYFTVNQFFAVTFSALILILLIFKMKKERLKRGSINETKAF